MENDWDGEGLPPVGMICEAYIYADTAKQGRPINRWVVGEFVGAAYASNGGCAGLFKTEEGRVHVIEAFSYFRQERTPEQIAAEEREVAASSMSQATQGAKDWMEAFRMLHDAGYRK